MRGMDEASVALFSYVDLEERVPAGHPLREIRQIVNDALASLDGGVRRALNEGGPPLDRAGAPDPGEPSANVFFRSGPAAAEPGSRTNSLDQIVNRRFFPALCI